jgi:hypothetical protein
LDEEVVLLCDDEAEDVLDDRVVIENVGELVVVLDDVSDGVFDKVLKEDLV